ncbi:PDZ/DHR/GLGF [Sulfurimonas denitrificans DSM 1251]|uniref:PDZ/DHR/GLGF n=1 Tax=Sulfurimonas denitrificans (strain ATCC 33889 / DSM 1251) TaxID=326298 RepID=Q30TR4_SULDN|nr:PDZ domain-containing protein [Sulfurimonas denitrificans]ABB43617.1 PDZ/DHR/GLGF [Sulfurimonas denitrificans DSM 1251]
MLRLLLALGLLFLNLHACKSSSESCRQKILDSGAILTQSLQIPIQKNYLLIFSQTPPKEKILKHDPFLSLYIIEDTKKFKYPFKINSHPSLGIIGVDNSRIINAKIAKKQVGLDSFATFSHTLSTPSLLLNSCCDLEAIVTERGIIEKEYIDRFIKIKNVSYGDIGIRVKDENSVVIVKESNPFVESNQLKVGDVILEFDTRKVKDSASFMRNILFSSIGSTHNVKIKRDNKIVTLRAITQKRLGGGFQRDVYLEFLGMQFDKKLFIVKVAKEAERFGLKVGDRLLQANTKDIKGADDIFDKADKVKNSLNLLFEREHFQFFVKVN